MKKILFFAFALVAGVMAFTSCDKKDGNTPELTGTVYHYRGASSFMNSEYSCEHDVYIALDEQTNKATMKWEGIKVSENAEPATFYLYDGSFEKTEEGFIFHFDATPQLPNGKPFDQWESVDVSGGTYETHLSFDYHINGVTGAIFDGELVKE